MIAKAPKLRLSHVPQKSYQKYTEPKCNEESSRHIIIALWEVESMCRQDENKTQEMIKLLVPLAGYR